MFAGPARLGRIRIYPIKALDPVEVAEARLLGSGGLQNDRRWAIFDAAGNFVNGKRKAAIHSIRTTYYLAAMEVSFGGASYSLTSQIPEIEAHLSERKYKLWG